MTWVTAGLMQGRTGVFAEQMQGQHLYILGYSVSVFGNSASILIAMLGLSGHSNGYRTTVVVAHNSSGDYSSHKVSRYSRVVLYDEIILQGEES